MVGAEPGLAGLAAGLLVLVALGDGLLRLLDRAALVPGPPSARGVAEGWGWRLLLSLGAVPFLCLLFDRTGVPITRPTFVIAALLIFAAGRARVRGPRPPAAAATPALPRTGLAALRRAPAAVAEGIRRAPAAALLRAAAASLVLLSLVQIGLFPPRAYDALVGYDAVGKIMAIEGRLVSSLFSVIHFNAQAVYPPFTACNQGYGYLFHPTMPRLWVPLLAAGFLLAFHGWLRRWTGSPTAAALAAFVVLLPPEMIFHLTVGQTDLPSMTYTALGLLATVAWLRGEEPAGPRRGMGGAGPAALCLLLATATRGENVLFAAALAVAGLARLRTRRWRALWIVGPAAAFFLFWNLYVVRLLFGYDPSAHFRSELTLDVGRMLEVLGLAARIIASRGAFGEFVWVLPLTAFLWVYGRIRGPRAELTGALLGLAAVCFLFYMPYFYMWDPVLNPLWSMEHTFKRGFFRFLPVFTAALIAAPPVLRLLQRCESLRGANGASARP